MKSQLPRHELLIIILELAARKEVKVIFKEQFSSIRSVLA